MKPKKITYINWWREGETVDSSRQRANNGLEEQFQPNDYMNPYGMQGGMPQQGVPYIQPLVVVPYVSSQQPVYYVDSEAEEPEVPAEYYEDLFEDEERYALEDEEKRVKTRKEKHKKIKEDNNGTYTK